MYAGKVSGSALTVLFQGGKGIFVSNRAGTVNISKPGFGTVVKSPDTAPTPPSRFNNEALREMDDGLSQDAGGNETDSAEANEAPSEDPDESAPANTSADESDEQNAGLDTDSEPADTVGQPQPAEQPSDSADLSGSDDGPAALDASTLAAPPTSSTASILELSDEISDDRLDEFVNDTLVSEIQTERTIGIVEQPILDLLQEMGFAGDPASGVPADGLQGYDARVKHKPIGATPDSEAMVKFGVNWHNRKFFGVAKSGNATGPQLPVCLFGDVSGSTLENMHVVGSGLDEFGPRVSAITGWSTFGQFYGSEAEAFGFAIEGLDVNVQFQTDQTGWTGYGAALSKGADAFEPAPPRGSQTWSGFVAGVAEDMSAPHLNRRVFMNSRASEFSFNVNKDTGILSGRLSASDAYGSGSRIDNLQIGGALGSAFVADDAMIAILGGTGCISSSGNTGGLKPHGNYLVTSGPDLQPTAPYTAWGYWEIAYQDPAFGTDYHVHIPGALWVAGPQTPAAAVDDLLSTNFVGNYVGGAQGVQIDPGGWMSELTGGRTDLTVEFNPTVTMPIHGTIGFDQVTLDVVGTPGSVTRDGFTARITNATDTAVSGAFFGPQAEALGGNFRAKTSDGNFYHGIFDGRRVP